jgi:putative nucleotidyltransferase with HDIG domain
MKRLTDRLGKFNPFRKRRRGGTLAATRRERLRALVRSSRTTRKTYAVDPARTGLFVGITLVLAFLLCVHLIPNHVNWRIGDPADREITAQRTVRYEDTTATRRMREDAVRQVEVKYDAIPGATSAAREAINVIFDRVEDGARRRATTSNTPLVPLASGAKPTQNRDTALATEIADEIRRETTLNVMPEEIQILLKRTAAERRKARDLSERLVERAMSRAITEDTTDLADARTLLTASDDLKALTPKEFRETVASLAGAALTPTRRVNQKETDRERAAARASIVPQMRRLPAGTTIIRTNERVTQQHLDQFAALGLQNDSLDSATVSVITLLVLALVTLMAAYLKQFHPELYEDTPRLLLLTILVVFSVAGLKVGSALLSLSVPGVHFSYLGMMCVASAGMVIALLISPRIAAVVVALLAVASGLILNNELRYTLITLASSLVGIVCVSQLKNRGDLLRATLILCGANALLNGIVGQLEGDLPRELLLGMLWGVVSGVFALALFYFGVAAFEKPFGITTHLRLLELSDPATPILQEFRLRVPGTYAHSLMVGNLAHAAAEAIGADSLLVRVAAYYHDLGKMNRPEFFIENQSNIENVHDRLAPSLSAIILASHVKEGLEIAEEIGLPPRVREVISQHHGTTLMKYFYHRATGGAHDPTLEAQFRYPGPKPQSREAAILMLADTVEAASRTLERPTPARVKDFVARLVEDKRADGQLDECTLTLRDLQAIQEVFVWTLCGTLHARIEYPNEKPAVPEPARLPNLTLSTVEACALPVPPDLALDNALDNADVTPLHKPAPEPLPESLAAALADSLPPIPDNLPSYGTTGDDSPPVEIAPLRTGRGSGEKPLKRRR